MMNTQVTDSLPAERRERVPGPGESLTPAPSLGWPLREFSTVSFYGPLFMGAF